MGGNTLTSYAEPMASKESSVTLSSVALLASAIVLPAHGVLGAAEFSPEGFDPASIPTSVHDPASVAQFELGFLSRDRNRCSKSVELLINSSKHVPPFFFL